MALKNAVVPALSTCIGVTAATPEVVETSFWSVCRRGSVVRGSLPFDELAPLAGCAGEPRETAMISGPLAPGPKYFDNRSYAWRAVVDVDSAAVSCWPRLSENSGIVNGIRMVSATSPAITGRLAMSAAHLAHSPVRACSSLCGLRTRSALMRGPRMARIAGSRVSAASTATTTATAAIRPIVVTKGMSAIASETSAIVTVPPAKNTAPPEVAAARAIDSRISSPSCRPRKWRVTMNSA